MRGGSWPWLGAAALVFFGLFFGQRQRSTFLAIELNRADLAATAVRHGLALAEVMALRDLIGSASALADHEAAAASFARERALLGDALAAVAVAGAPKLAHAQRLLAPDAATAWQRFRTDPAAVPGLRYLAICERFATRVAARD